MRTVFEELRADHEAHRNLMQIIATTHGDTEQRRMLFKQLRQDLIAHAEVEELTLYAEMLAVDSGREKAAHSIAEHQEMDELLDALDKMAFDNPHWLPTFKKLRHAVEHHEAEEEHEVFQVAGKILEEQQKFDLAIEFRSEKEIKLACLR